MLNVYHPRRAKRKEFDLWTNLVNESAGEEARIYLVTIKKQEI